MANPIVSQFKDEEKEAVATLKAELDDILTASELEEGYKLWDVPLSKTSEDERLDVILIKFLRARNLSCPDAKAQLISMLKWRKEFKADTILTETFPAETFSKLGFIHSVDSFNRPVTYNLYGAESSAEAFSDLDRFIRWRVQLMEKGIRQLDFVNTDSMVQVHDYAGVGFGSYDKNTKQASKAVTALMQDNYPEFLAVKYFINVPWWGDVVFKFISVFLSEQTKKKFIVATSGGTHAALSRLINEENLPTFYGGKSVVPGFEDKNV
ncbi:9168_t:CDS:2 [Paraglomus occultum]|uniref:9168_t:CDS:1 n=1 Tax=Paraglomus occultum TaxID=144539 RepID=A0A9N8WC96_9GLOM|nr:9168_t:CDS:2 [Paraglomus occultum]